MTPRQVVVSAVVVGFALRLGFALGYWVDKPLTHDEREYLELARNLAAGHGFAYDTGEPALDDAEHFGRAPAYPLFIVLATGGRVTVDRVPDSLKIAQSAVGAAAIGVLAWIAAGSAGPWAGAGAAAIAAVYPPLVWICAYALSEAFYSVVALLSAALLGIVTSPRPAAVSADRTSPAPRPPSLVTRPSFLVPAWAPAFASGLAAGVATLTRPATLFFIALTVPWLLSKRRAVLAAFFVAGAALMIAPWTLRNVRVHDRFVLVSSQGGVTFWTGNNPLARGEGDMAANPAIKRRNQELRAQHATFGPEELEPIYMREAWSFIREQPAAWLWLLARKLFYTFIPVGPSYTLHSTLYYTASVIAYGMLIPFAVAGFFELYRSGAQPWPLWMLAASALLVCMVFFPQERFRIPVIDPALIVCAGAWPGWMKILR